MYYEKVKVLIIGQPFNNISGGGITISNLFDQIPRENILLATTYEKSLMNDSSLCNNVYIFNDTEIKLKYPFSLFLKYKRGLLYGKDKIIEVNKNSTLNRLIKGVFKKIVFFLNLQQFVFNVSISEEFINWVIDKKIDVIYSHLSIYENIIITRKLVEITKLPLIIHTYDDWPLLKARGFLSFYWQKKIEKQFKDILKYVETSLCISDSMREEYHRRYSLKSQVFHNPIDKQLFNNFSNQKISLDNSEDIVITYTGQIGYTNYSSIIDVIKSILIINKQGYRVKLKIYSNWKDQGIKNKLSNYSVVEIAHTVQNSEIPKILSEADILLLPLCFNKRCTKYVKLSWPTKASEYMASGTPILLYAPKDIAVSKHNIKHNWANGVYENTISKIAYKLKWIIDNYSESKNISKNAKIYAYNNFDKMIYRNKIIEIFNELL